VGATEVVVRPRVVSPFQASLRVALRRMQVVWVGIRHSRTAMVGLAILVLFIGMAVFAPWLAPYGPIERVADTSNCVPNISSVGDQRGGIRHLFTSNLGVPD